MTEEEWLECKDSVPMLEYLQGRASERKLRLFACNCIRNNWNLVTNAYSRRWVEVEEAYIDGKLERAELVAALADRGQGETDDNIRWAEQMASDAYYHAISCALSVARHAFQSDPNMNDAKPNISEGFLVPTMVDESSKERAKQTRLLCELLGPLPFHPVTLNPAWLTPTVKQLAAVIYEERQSDKMPILADALLDAGCDNEEVLKHCQNGGEHVRGCWVIDILLDKH
jgi:hypothetical protein